MVDATDGLLARTPHHDLATLLPVLKRQGYRGVEVPLKFALSLDDGGKGARFRDLLEENDLQIGSMIFTDGPAAAGEPGAFGPAIAGFSPGTEPGAAMSTPAQQQKVVDEHLLMFKQQADASREFFGDRLEFINSHSGKVCVRCAVCEGFALVALLRCPLRDSPLSSDPMTCPVDLFYLDLPCFVLLCLALSWTTLPPAWPRSSFPPRSSTIRR